MVSKFVYFFICWREISGNRVALFIIDSLTRGKIGHGSDGFMSGFNVCDYLTEIYISMKKLDALHH